MEHFATMRPLEYYDISVKTGFLPSTAPLRRLPDAYFSPWEDMMDDFNGLLLAGKLREKIQKVLIIVSLKKKKDNLMKQPKKDAIIGPYTLSISRRI